ncbi:MAG: hypothetical protein PUB21_08115, partial [Bacteroidales bacterium]|nr:hypothetical protein [Bacteroidales bacterium]
PDPLTVGGSRDRRATGIPSLPDHLTVGGFLDLEGTGITSLPDNLTVGDSLDLEGTGITSLPDNLTVGGSLDLRGTGITSLPDNLTVGGSIDLRDTGITSLPDNLTVGGSLNLRGTGITSLPDNLTVGGFLDLRGTGITSLPDNLTVGGFLDLRGTGITDISKVNKNIPKLYEWRNRKYIKSDGIFSEVINQKGNIYRTRQIGKTNIDYLITDGNGKWAHGKTLEEAKKDLIYKIGNRDKSEYKNLTLESELTLEDAIEAYRVITGACSFGTRSFIENKLKDRKEKYKISEIILLTKGEYGNDQFNKYFDEK